MLALVAIGVIAAVAYTMRPREVVAPPPKTESLPPGVAYKTEGGDAIRLKGSDQDIRIEFESQTTSTEGETTLHGVKINVEKRADRSFVVTGKQAFLGKDNSSFDVRGDVKLQTSDGLTASGQQATYSDAEKIVRVPGVVTFQRGRMTGSGVGFTYDEQRDTMWILDKADVKFAADKTAGAMAFTAGTFGYARRDRYMRFERTMHMDREGELIDTNESTVRLFPDRDETDFIELRGDSKVTGGPNNNALRLMEARDINLDYGDDGRTLQNATLAGNAAIQLAPKGASGGQRLAGGFMDIGLEPDGSVRSLSAREGVAVTLPAAKDTPARSIRSNELTAAGNAQGLRDMKFTEGVEYREAGSKGQTGRIVRARTLEDALDAAAGTLQ